MNDMSDLWQVEDGMLVAPLADAQGQDYETYLSSWQASSHPALFRLETWCVNGGQVRIGLRGNQDFSARKADGGFIKLTALRQALDAVQSGFLLCPHPGLVWFHRSGYARWLPVPPGWRDVPIEQALACLLADWFGYSGEDFPWEWRTFWQTYTAQSGSAQEEERSDWGARLDYFLLRAWPYGEAHRLAMKDRLLAPEQAAQLSRMGNLLGLSEVEQQRLDQLSLQDETNFEDWI